MLFLILQFHQRGSEWSPVLKTPYTFDLSLTIQWKFDWIVISSEYTCVPNNLEKEKGCRENKKTMIDVYNIDWLYMKKISFISGPNTLSTMPKDNSPLSLCPLPLPLSVIFSGSQCCQVGKLVHPQKSWFEMLSVWLATSVSPCCNGLD